ncbi:uncharacterized protein LOC127092882 [Lathyrus oleraceus]|uniref:Transmembrane protein n=1 Tax=Pisum sativum TaxID=3888 RepID=A0A9D4W477_PEA|nr:uncharacterized protein LOC127092882 [Pisum sativum]KAI5394782.1 hypothetical protein KIW84_061411 [Pisum sativum]
MMDLEETEDEDMDTIITSTSQQHWFEPNANSGDKVNCMLERGLNVGRKILVFGFVATSVPLVVPGFLVASAIGLVVSMPCCFFLVSHRCTQSLMSKLLPKPRLNSSQDVCFKQDIDVTYIDKDDEAKRDSEIVDVNEETVILDNDYEHGVVKEEFEPELTHHSGDADSVIHDDENMEGYLSGESSEERLMSRGTIIEGFDETEELKASFEFGDTAVVLEEYGDEVKEGDIEEEEMQKETKGLLEKIRDEGRNDMRGISSETSENDQDIGQVVENMEEKQDLGTDGEMWNQEDSKVYKEMIHSVQSRNDDSTNIVCNDVESCEPTRGILELEDDGLNDSKKLVDETSELLDGRSLQDEPIGDLLKEMHVLHALVAEDSSEVEEVEPAISNLVNQETELREYNKRMNSPDADAREIADEVEFHLCDENIIDAEAYSCTIDLHEEPSNVKEEFEPDLSHRSSDVDNVVQHNCSEEDNNDYFAQEEEEEPSSQNHDDEKMEGCLSGESSEERLMSRGTILKGFDETEELKAPFEFGDATVVLEECEDDVKEGDIDEEKMQEETKGLLEKIRDEGRNDMRGISSETSENDQVVENMEVGREEEQDMGTDGDMRNQEDSKVNNETIHDDNTSVCNEVESCEPTSGILELEDDGLNDQKKPVDETPELLDGRGFQEEPSGDLLIETQVLHILVAEDSFEVKELEHVISKKGELDENISNLVNQETDLCENNKRMNSSDADTDAREIPDEIEYHSCDEDRIDAGAHSYTIDLHEEPSNVTVDMHTDSLEVLVSSEEQESTSSKCASEKNFVCSSDEVLFNDENIWKQIHVVRKIIGYEGTIQASCADELKALYIFTGVEPPSFVKENLLDPAEINEKLHFLMSIVGVKMTDLP